MSFLASMVGGICISIMVTPFDLILTRLYNQRKSNTIKSINNFQPFFNYNLNLCFSAVGADGKGVHYKNYADCVSKIYKTEGISAFYKGVGPMYFRLGPHTVLCLVFWDVFKDLLSKGYKQKSILVQSENINR